MLTITIVLLGLLALTSCSQHISNNSNNRLFPLNSELFYQWTALVRAGTDNPTPYASVFVLNGIIQIQHFSNATHMKLSNLTFQLYNGILDHKHEIQAKEIPVESLDVDVLKYLENGFIMIHDQNGLATGIITEKDEKEFSRNIKRSIASIMQMDIEALRVETHKSFSSRFSKSEQCLYGNGLVDYTIHNNGEHIEVQKTYTIKNFEHTVMNYFLISNTKSLPCDRHLEDIITSNSERKYKIVMGEFAENDKVKKNKVLLAKEIQAKGGIFYNPFDGNSDSQYIIVDQAFTLVNVTSTISKQIEVKLQYEQEDLTYRVFDSNSDDPPDITQGRGQTPDYTKVMPVIEQMLSDILDYFEHDHLHTKSPNTKQEQTVNRVLHLLQVFKLEHLEKLYDSLKQEDTFKLNVFFNILPLIGTRHSTKMIKNLIMQKQVKDEVALEILQHMHENIFLPSLELVQDIEDLFDLQEEEVNEDVKKSAALSFSNMVHKCLLHAHKFKNTNVNEYFGKYVLAAMKKIKESQHYKDKLTYMSVLYNIKLPLIAEHLMPIVIGETSDSNDVRSLALWAIAPAIAYGSDQQIGIKTFWSILSNRKENPELRVTAYYLMMEGKPNNSQLFNIYWLMMTEPNQELYRFHFTYVKSKIDSSNSCNQDFRLRLLQIMKNMQPPRYGSSSFTLSDFEDNHFGFADGLSTTFFDYNETRLFSISSAPQVFNLFTQDLTFFIKIHGLKTSIFELLSLPQPQYWSTIGRDDFYIQIMILKQQQIVNVIYLDFSNMNLVLEYLVKLIYNENSSRTNKLLNIEYARYQKILFPTDLGIPASWELLIPLVRKVELFAEQPTAPPSVMEFHLESKQSTSMHFRHGLSFYNPIANVWQGINRYHATDFVVPVNFDVTINLEEGSFKLAWKKESNSSKTGGFRSHVKQMVFIKDDLRTNILRKSSPESKEWIIVEHENPQINTATLIEYDDVYTGHKYQVQVYDTNSHITNNPLKYLTDVFSHSARQGSNSISSYYSVLQNNLLLLPNRGKHGVLVKIEPSQNITNIDLKIKFNNAFSNRFSGKFEFDPCISYSVRNNEEFLKNWTIDIDFNLNERHTINNIGVIMTESLPGKIDHKICIKAGKTWTIDGVSGDFLLAIQNTPYQFCMRNDPMVTISMTGQRSHEQIEKNVDYEACSYAIPYAVTKFYTLDCLIDKTSLRHYQYTIKIENLSFQLANNLKQVWNYIKSYLIPYYTFDNNEDNDDESDELKIDVLYPMQAKEVDVKITTPTHIHKFTSLPLKNVLLKSLIPEPDNTMYSIPDNLWFIKMLTTYCRADHDKITLNEFSVDETVSKDWSLYYATISNATIGDEEQLIFLKEFDKNSLEMKIVDSNHTFEVKILAEIVISVDGQILNSHQQFYSSDWIDYQIINSEKANEGIAFELHHSFVHGVFDGQKAVITFAREYVLDKENEKRKCMIPLLK